MPEDKVLIVDDDKYIRKMCQFTLQQIGLMTDTAESAEEALELIEKTKYPVILLDNILPGMSGVELLQKIKATAPETKVIMYSGESTLQFETESVKNGADAFIAKPFAPQKLKEVIQQAL